MNKFNNLDYLLHDLNGSKDPNEYRTCTDCHSEFCITPEEQTWYRNKGMALPKRCRDCRGYRRQQKIRKNIMGRSDEPLPTPFTLSSVDWKRDESTECFKRENADELLFPARMSEDRLAVVCTYCNSIDNPYAHELIRRAGNLDTFRTTTDEGERKWILRESAKSFGITIF